MTENITERNNRNKRKKYNIERKDRNYIILYLTEIIKERNKETKETKKKERNETKPNQTKRFEKTK